MGPQSSAKQVALPIADADGKARRKPFWSGAKFVAFAAIVYFFVLPLIPGFRKAATELRRVSPLLLALGVGLEAAALYAYSLLTKAALGTSRKALTSWRMFRIQMSTKASAASCPAAVRPVQQWVTTC